MSSYYRILIYICLGSTALDITREINSYTDAGKMPEAIGMIFLTLMFVISAKLISKELDKND
jgi:hypothetical protein